MNGKMMRRWFRYQKRLYISQLIGQHTVSVGCPVDFVEDIISRMCSKSFTTYGRVCMWVPWAFKTLLCSTTLTQTKHRRGRMNFLLCVQYYFRVLLRWDLWRSLLASFTRSVVPGFFKDFSLRKTCSIWHQSSFLLAFTLFFLLSASALYQGAFFLLQ